MCTIVAMYDRWLIAVVIGAAAERCEWARRRDGVTRLARETTMVLGLLALSACSSTGLEYRLSNLEAEEVRRRAKLDELEQQITMAELRADYAKAYAGYQECKAARASISAEVKVRRAGCAQELAGHAQCVAENDKKTSTGAATGCLIGIGLAAITGGAAAPIALAGCAGGAAIGTATRSKCGDVPRCMSYINSMEPIVLADMGLSEKPTCVEPEKPQLPAPTVPKPRQEPVEAPTVVREIEQPPSPPRRTVCTEQRIAWVEFIVPERKADGHTWDPRGGEPDLRYKVYVEGQARYESQAHETLKWHHEPQADLRLAAQQQLSVQLLDSDQQSAETIAVFRTVAPVDTREALNLSMGRVRARIKLECVEE